MIYKFREFGGNPERIIPSQALKEEGVEIRERIRHYEVEIVFTTNGIKKSITWYDVWRWMFSNF